MSRWHPMWQAALVGAMTLAVYATTIAPTVGWTDTGELMAVAQTFGTAHPTGYPLMTVIARAWLLVPSGLRPAVQLNLLSAVLVSVSAGLFFVFFRRSFTDVRKGSRLHHPFAPLIGVGVLATSLTFWLQSSSYEVYALHLLMMSAILVSYARAASEQAASPAESARWWFVFAYAVGLSFGNHMTTVLLGPGLLWDFFRRFGLSPTSWRRLGRMLVPAACGLSIYVILPIRAASHPPLNWGDPSTLEALWRHVTGAQYRLWMFSSADVVARQWSGFVNGLTQEFVWPWLAIAGWGWVVSWRRWKRMAEFSAILAATGVLYSVNYDIHEIGPYFLVVYVAIGVCVVPGLIDLAERAARLSSIGPAGVAIASALLVLWQGIDHHPQIRKANPPAIEAFARNVLQGVDPNAVIVTGRWDYLYSPILYLQSVEHLRTDVLVIDHSLLRDRLWYLEALRRRAPWLQEALGQAFDDFAKELRKFERGEPFVPALIQMRWDALWTGILRKAGERGAVYLDVRLAAELRSEHPAADGHLVRIDQRASNWVGRLPDPILIDGNENAYLRDFREYLATSYLTHAFQLRSQGREFSADSLARIAAEYSGRHPWLTAFPLSRK